MATDKTDRKHVYEAVRGMVEHNTGDSQPPSLRLATLHTHARHAALDKSATKSALRALTNNDEIAAYEDRTGTTRLCVKDEASLLAVIDAETEHEAPDKRTIAAINQHLADVRGGGDD